MFRYVLIAGIVLVSIMTFQLYEVSYNTNDVRTNIKLLKAEITKEKQNINNLRFELSAAKQPQNIQKLNDELLHLVPQKIEQLISIKQLPFKIAKALPEASSLTNAQGEPIKSIAELSAELIGQ